MFDILDLLYTRTRENIALAEQLAKGQNTSIAQVLKDAGLNVFGIFKAKDLLSPNFGRFKGLRISDLSPLRGFVDLDYLDLDDNQITDLSPLKGLTNLMNLYLGNNKIKDLSPLKDLANLTILSFKDNQISDLSPLKNLSRLVCLFSNNNQISDLSPLKSLMSLKTVYLRNNPLPTKFILKFVLPHPKAEIHY